MAKETNSLPSLVMDRSAELMATVARQQAPLTAEQRDALLDLGHQLKTIADVTVDMGG